MSLPMSDDLNAHYDMIIKAITDGRVVPFFGAGVNSSGRPAEMAWQRGQYLPSGGELAETHLQVLGDSVEPAAD